MASAGSRRRWSRDWTIGVMHSRDDVKTGGSCSSCSSCSQSETASRLLGVMTLALIALFPTMLFASSLQPAVRIPDSPFIEAVRDGDIEAVSGTLVRGQTPDVRDKTGTPALFVALEFDQPEMFQFLIEQGAKVRAKNKAGDTLLAVLAGTKRVNLAQSVLQAGADPDRFGASGEPPIIIAARAGEIEMIRLLLAHDVDFDATDLTGRSALSIAKEGRQQAIIDLLEAVGAQ